MPQRLPLLIRIALASERFRCTVERLQRLLSEEVLWAWTGPQQREAINRVVYSGKEMYLPGGRIFEEGLLDRERIAFATPPFPPSGRILLGGAGGGRELHALCGMGYDVMAFDPCEQLCEGARQVVSGYPKSTVVCASYADLVTAAEQRSGPLAAHVLNTSFDAVLFGLRSFNYVFTDLDREALLRATRTIAPKAPLLFTFVVRPQGAENGRLDRLRAPLRRLFKLVKAPSARRPGDRFMLGSGFIHALTHDEVRTVADQTGYRIVYYRQGDTNLNHHALLMPQ
jgi:hypothetical protein